VPVTIVVIEGPSPFYSYPDEKSFFDRLEAIRSVQKIEGRGRNLEIKMRTPISDVGLRELLSVLTRYGLRDLSSLQQLANSRNRGWFEDPQMYWHRAVFGRHRAG
jgi:hypothetical protein